MMKALPNLGVQSFFAELLAKWITGDRWIYMMAPSCIERRTREIAHKRSISKPLKLAGRESMTVLSATDRQLAFKGDLRSFAKH